MNPAFSVIAFTLLAGTAQGLAVMCSLAALAGFAMTPHFLSRSVLTATGMLLLGLGASFVHLGRPERAWRAATMWRTSWLSREVIVLPLCIALLSCWWLTLQQADHTLLTRGLIPLGILAASAALWYCTSMIYACLRFIEEWAHPITLVNFVLVGLSSGLLLACALASWYSERAFLAASGPAAITFTALAWASRTMALRRNAAIRHRSTLQTATGIHASRLVQTSMGMSAGSFNTREFFHRASPFMFKGIRQAGICLSFAAPLVAMSIAWLGQWDAGWTTALVLQIPGLVADRWLFFAQAKHPQNLYYQVVS